MIVSDCFARLFVYCINLRKENVQNNKNSFYKKIHSPGILSLIHANLMLHSGFYDFGRFWIPELLVIEF